MEIKLHQVFEEATVHLQRVSWLLCLYTGCNLPQFFWLFSSTPFQNKNKVFKPCYKEQLTINVVP